MARPPRTHIPGCLYHVIARGNARQPIFLEVEDYRRFLSLVVDAASKYGHRLHAYCLMTNHLLCAAPHKMCCDECRVMWS
jgi:putative transposase